jgi:hypothetical protein
METFFRENRSEVTKTMVLDYTWERREELIRAEEYEDGKREEYAEERSVEELKVKNWVEPRVRKLCKRNCCKI